MYLARSHCLQSSDRVIFALPDFRLDDSPQRPELVDPPIQAYRNLDFHTRLTCCQSYFYTSRSGPERGVFSTALVDITYIIRIFGSQIKTAGRSCPAVQ
jgi:hypothetical protein